MNARAVEKHLAGGPVGRAPLMPCIKEINRIVYLVINSEVSNEGRNSIGGFYI